MILKLIGLLMAFCLGMLLTAFAEDPSPSRDPYLSLDVLKPSVPRDVARLIERTEACSHWAGEEVCALDGKRLQAMETDIRHNHCRRLDRDTLRLRRRYANDEVVRPVFPLLEQLR